MFGGGSGGFKLMRFKGVDVYLDVSVVFMMGLLIYSNIGGFPSQWSQGETWTAIALICMFFIGSILVHELSHAWFGMILGGTVSMIRLYVFGGATFFTSKPSSELRNFWISAVGPLSNLVLWQIFSFAYRAADGYSVWFVVCSYLASVNLLLGIFNALPGYPMDGGQAVRSLLVWLTKRELLAAQIVMGLGYMVVAGIVGWTLINLNAFNNPMNLVNNPLSVVFTGFIAYWIATGSYNQYQQAKQFQPSYIDSRSTVASRPKPTGTTVGQILSQPLWDFRLDTTSTDFLLQTANLDDKVWLPVLREGYLMGIVNRKTVGKIVDKSLEDVMIARRNVLVMSIGDDVSEAREMLKISKEQPIAILGPGGVFAGFVTRENLPR